MLTFQKTFSPPLSVNTIPSSNILIVTALKTALKLEQKHKWSDTHSSTALNQTHVNEAVTVALCESESNIAVSAPLLSFQNYEY
jgi:hypothetical protein